MRSALERIKAMRAAELERHDRLPLLRSAGYGSEPVPVTITAVHDASFGELIADANGKKVQIRGTLLRLIHNEAARRGCDDPQQLVGMRLIPEKHPRLGWRYIPERKA
ncbi:hypothetical protein SAMN03159338_1490 [Sphingomonas sp. NFR04]|uniref:hypothetical protein n=1 Tax=Sphingomonas sp. NFR04 TaxID=1566283 RepID=UPI0008E632E6|nr:hypothetical protein [Sphingomonas sp. NFR04]SFJ47385.1 hypothetical protein SAMN03159338_1490 [Sphingomonas sp. NFR04]